MGDSLHPHLLGADSSQGRTPSFPSPPTHPLGGRVGRMEALALFPSTPPLQVREARLGSRTVAGNFAASSASPCDQEMPLEHLNPSILEDRAGRVQMPHFLLHRPAARGSQQGREGAATGNSGDFQSAAFSPSSSSHSKGGGGEACVSVTPPFRASWGF